MTGQRRSALNRLGWIFGVTVFFQLLNLAMGADLPKVLFRFLVLAILFALLLKGFGFARYVLGLLYLAGGLFALFAVLQKFPNMTVVFSMTPIGLWSLAAAWFFFRSNVLAAWTRSSQSLI